MFTPPPGFFEVFDGGAFHPDYSLTLKPTSDCMLRVGARHEKARGNYVWGSGIPHGFPIPYGLHSFRNARRAQGITAYRARRQSRPRNGKPMSGRFICAGPELSYNA